MNAYLPGYTSTPIGGYKVCYEYAARLAKRGHTVTVVHPMRFDPLQPIGLARRLRSYPWVLRRYIQRPSIPWFQFSREVTLRFVPNLSSKYVPRADAVIATGWQTAEYADRYGSKRGEKFYLVYDYEFWRSGNEVLKRRIAKTHVGTLHIICTSPSVAEMLAATGGRAAAYIPAGIELERFRITRPIDRRDRGVIGFQARPGAHRGLDDMLAAADLLRATYGSALRFRSFGPSYMRLPDWVDHRADPSDDGLVEFYNSLSIFVLSSHYEGWGLPGMEAMACGAALVSTDSIGMRDYATEGTSALITPIADPSALARAISRLVEDDLLRQRLASAGNLHVQRLTWANAVNKLEHLLMQHGNGTRADEAMPIGGRA